MWRNEPANFLSEAERHTRAWQEAFNAGDAAAVANMYTEDAVVFRIPAGHSFEGRKAIQMWAQESIGHGITLEVTVTEGEYLESKMAGFSRGTFAVLETDGSVASGGAFLSVLKLENGEWKTHRQLDGMVPQR